LNEANTAEQKELRAMPTFETILVIIVTFILVVFLGSSVYLMIGIGMALIVTELIILIVPLAYLLAKRVDIKRYVGLKVNPKLIMIGLISGGVLLFVNIFVTAGLTTIFGVSEAIEQTNNMIIELTASTPGLITVIIALAMAGICEEFAFRGFLQSTLTRKYSFLPAVIASAFVFGLFHFDPQVVYILSALTAGLVLGYIYHRWNSYIAAAIAHSTVNLTVLAALLLVQ
jgi:membrane protease YdiL (CAAX protease family)